jgi:hypothetical protein
MLYEHETLAPGASASGLPAQAACTRLPDAPPDVTNTSPSGTGAEPFRLGLVTWREAGGPPPKVIP